MYDPLTVDDELFLLQLGCTPLEVATLALMRQLERNPPEKGESSREMVALLERTGAVTLGELLEAGNAEAVAFTRRLLARRLLAWRHEDADASE